MTADTYRTSFSPVVLTPNGRYLVLCIPGLPTGKVAVLRLIEWGVVVLAENPKSLLSSVLHGHLHGLVLRDAVVPAPHGVSPMVGVRLLDLHPSRPEGGSSTVCSGALAAGPGRRPRG